MSARSTGLGTAVFESRLEKIRMLLRDHGLERLVISAPTTLSWLFSGRWNVPNTLDAACCDVIVYRDASRPAEVVANEIEAPRLRDTEFAGLDLGWVVVPWTEDRRVQIPVGEGVASDSGMPGCVDLSAECSSLIACFDSTHIEALRAVSRETAEAGWDAAHRITPGMTEYEAAAELSAALLRRGVEPVCLFVAADGRAARHRHPLPTAAVVEESVTLVACGRSNGMIASLTRHVSFAALTDAHAEHYSRLLEVERVFLDASVPDATLSHVLQKGIEAYALNGFDGEEWKRHHQGGLSGVAPRSPIATPQRTQRLSDESVVAWNPSAGRWKVEDTCLVSPLGAVPLVSEPEWPTVNVGGRQRPGILVRSA